MIDNSNVVNYNYWSLHVQYQLLIFKVYFKDKCDHPTYRATEWVLFNEWHKMALFILKTLNNINSYVWESPSCKKVQSWSGISLDLSSSPHPLLESYVAWRNEWYHPRASKELADVRACHALPIHSNCMSVKSEFCWIHNTMHITR